MTTPNLSEDLIYFATDADELKYFQSAHTNSTKQLNNQWIVYLLIGAVIVGLIVYSNYLYQRNMRTIKHQQVNK